MQDIVVLGAGRQALETAGYCRGAGLRPVAFVEEFPPAYERDAAVFGAPILTFEDDLEACRRLPALSAVGSPRLRRALIERWGDAQYVALLAERSWLAHDAVVDGGATIAPQAVVNRLAHVGAHVLVNVGAVVSHDVVVGDFATISPGCVIAGATRVGADAFLGVGATVLGGLTIGMGAYVAAGAVVIDDVADGHLAMGVPARSAPKRGDLG